LQECKLGAHAQRSHIIAASGSPRFSSAELRPRHARTYVYFSLHLAESGMSICNSNRIMMTGVRTLRRLDLDAEIYHIREPQKIPLVISSDEMRRSLSS
jgi:integrase/recombinase XerD